MRTVVKRGGTKVPSTQMQCPHVFVFFFLNDAFFLKWASAVQNINGNKNNKPEAETCARHRREGDKNDGWTDKDWKAQTLLFIQTKCVINCVVCCWVSSRLAGSCSFSNKVKTAHFFKILIIVLFKCLTPDNGNIDLELQGLTSEELIRS